MLISVFQTDLNVTGQNPTAISYKTAIFIHFATFSAEKQATLYIVQPL